jgi:hypothetical protein
VKIEIDRDFIDPNTALLLDEGMTVSIQSYEGVPVKVRVPQMLPKKIKVFTCHLRLCDFYVIARSR